MKKEGFFQEGDGGDFRGGFFFLKPGESFPFFTKKKGGEKIFPRFFLGKGRV